MFNALAELNGNLNFFHIPPEISFSVKFGPKIQNCQFKVKPDTETNLNM